MKEYIAGNHIKRKQGIIQLNDIENGDHGLRFCSFSIIKILCNFLTSSYKFLCLKTDCELARQSKLFFFPCWKWEGGKSKRSSEFVSERERGLVGAKIKK